MDSRYASGTHGPFGVDISITCQKQRRANETFWRKGFLSIMFNVFSNHSGRTVNIVTSPA